MGYIHYITTEGEIKSINSDVAPSKNELIEFVGGDVGYERIWPNRKRQLLAHKIQPEKSDKVNQFATVLRQEILKYQNGLKKIDPQGGGEEQITCIEAIACCDIMPHWPKVYGNAVYLEDLQPRSME